MSLQKEEMLRDGRNITLLSLLQGNPRLGTAELARRVGMSPPAVRERIHRLEEAGIIRGYRVELDPAALGYPVSAYVRVRPAPGQLPKIAELARSLAEVVECHRVTGEDCLLMKMLAPTVQQLESLLDRFLMLGNTTSSLIVSSPVPPRNPPLPQAPP